MSVVPYYCQFAKLEDHFPIVRDEVEAVEQVKGRRRVNECEVKAFHTETSLIVICQFNQPPSVRSVADLVVPATGKINQALESVSAESEAYDWTYVAGTDSLRDQMYCSLLLVGEFV
jgi:hypothetical protein